MPEQQPLGDERIPHVETPGRERRHRAALAAQSGRADTGQPQRTDQDQLLEDLAGDDLVANVTMSFFQLGRSYLEGFSVYGDEGALEWPQLEGGPMKEFRMQPMTDGRRGRAVSEADVAAAQRFAAERLRLVVEPGGAVALAALLTGKVTPTDGMLVLLSGGNVDRAAYARVLAG